MPRLSRRARRQVPNPPSSDEDIDDDAFFAAWKEKQQKAEQLYAAKRAERFAAEQALFNQLCSDPDPTTAKRSLYACGSEFVTLDEIPTWAEVSSDEQERERLVKAAAGVPAVHQAPRFSFSNVLNSKISLFRGDITTLEVDAIVNAANQSLLGGGGIDGAIHDAAGMLLQAECAALGGCPTGSTKITHGYRLPAKYVLHTVGPIGGGDALLQGCYESLLDIVANSHTHHHSSQSDDTSPVNERRSAIRSVALCCVSTGIFSFPRVRATHIALRVVRRWLETHHTLVDRVIFCVFAESDLRVYETLLQSYFPLAVDCGLPSDAVCPDDIMFPFQRDVDGMQSQCREANTSPSSRSSAGLVATESPPRTSAPEPLLLASVTQPDAEAPVEGTQNSLDEMD